MSVFFNGRLLVTPTSETQVYDEAMLDRNLPVGNAIALIGRSKGGAPKTPILLRGPEHARQVLKDGDLLKAVEKAFAPSSEAAGPSRVTVLRVNPATQSNLVLVDGSGNEVITLASSDYGVYANQLQVKIEAGSVSGLRISTRYNNQYYSQDNIARTALTVVYSGAATTATLTATETAVTVSLDAADTVISLADVPSTVSLVDVLNGIPGITATCTAAVENLPVLRSLDAVNAQDIKTSFAVPANLQAAIDWFNGLGEGYVSATRETGAGAIPVVMDWTGLTGATDGTVTSQDWQDCFSALQSVDVQWVVPCSGDASVWAMADAHVIYMSASGHRERRAFVGGLAGTSPEQAAADAASIASDRTAYVYPAVYDYDSAGKLTLYPAYIAAAAVGGCFAGTNPGTPITNKYLRFPSLERDLVMPADTDVLIQSGVLCLVPGATGGVRVVKSISTWLKDSKFNRVEVSTGFATDYAARSVRETLYSQIGKKATPDALTRAVSITDSVLYRLAEAEPMGPGVIVGYRGIQAAIEGDTLRVWFEMSPVIPINYVLVSIWATPWSSTVETTASGTA